MADPGGDPDGPIELVLPADPRLVRVARMTASGVGTAAGFDIEELEDLRIAVDELCTALLEGGDGSALLLGFDLTGGEVRVMGTTGLDGHLVLDGERLTLSRQILSVVVDEHEIDASHGRLAVRLRKVRAGASGDG